MTSPRAHYAATAGFTLVELLASVTILAALGTIASSLMFQALDHYADASTAAQLQSEESSALDRAVGALQGIGPDPDYAGLAPHLTGITPSSVSWQDASHRAYGLSTSGAQLQLVEAGASAVVLLNNVTSFQVRAYDKDNVALATTLSAAQCVPVRRIQIELTVQRAGRTQSLRTRLFLSSMMDAP